MSKNYPRQLITEISENMDEKLLQFQIQYKDTFHFLDISITTILDEIIEKYYMNTDSIADLLQYQKKKRRNQKKRWLENITQLCEKKSLQDPKHPFYTLILNYNTSTPEQKKIIYNNESIEQIIEKRIKETAIWAKNIHTYLINYPAITSLTEKIAFNAYKSDIVIFVGKYINEKYQGDPTALYLDFPSLNMPDTDGIPIFGAHRVELNLVDEKEALVEYLRFDEDTVLKTIVAKSNDFSVKTVKSLDTKDYEILTSALNSGIEPDFYTDGRLYFPLGAAAKVLGGKKPSKHHYDQASDRLKNWPKAQYEIVNMKHSQLGGTFNLFDSVLIDKEENAKSFVTVTCGSIIKDCIIKAQVTRINAKDYQSLKNKLTKLISLILQEERIKQAAMKPDFNNDKVFKLDCSYYFFSRRIRFRDNSDKRNMLDIIESFQELKENGIIVSDFSHKNLTIKLMLYTLTENERADINFLSKVIQ